MKSTKSARRQYAETYAARHPVKVKQIAKNWRAGNLVRNTPEVIAEYVRTGKPKSCGHCRVVKVLADYRIDRTMKDGLDSICRPCRQDIERVGRARRKLIKGSGNAHQ
jgi:hypothetical protein